MPSIKGHKNYTNNRGVINHDLKSLTEEEWLCFEAEAHVFMSAAFDF